MVKKRFLIFLALMAMLALPVWSSADVLRNQEITSDNYISYLSFVADPDPGLLDVPPVAHKYDRYEADDFTTGTDTWSVTKIFVPGGFHDTANPPHFPGLPNTNSTLLSAASLNWIIYADNSGFPAGNPVTGLGSSPVWSLSLAPSNGQVTITNGMVPGGDPYPSNVLLTLSTPVILGPGTYWLIFYPVADATVIGRWGRQVSNSVNGADAVVAGGGDGIPSAWTSVRDASTWNLPTKDFAFSLEGTAGAPAPILSVSPAGPIPFNSVQTGQTSAATQVTISNTGTTQLNVTSIAVAGDDNTQFAVATGGTNPCASLTPTINAGANCTVNVTFSPTTVGDKTATLDVASNGGSASITLGGTGVNPDIAVSPVGPINFNSVQTGQTSAATQVTISNTGAVPLNITSIAVTGGDNTQFAVAVGGTTPCASLTPTINAGANCTVNVTFAPTTVGAKTSTLTIASNDHDTPNATVTLNGTGVNPDIAVSPVGPIPFGSVQTGQTSAATQVTITNNGTTSLIVSSIAVTGGDNTQFAVAVGGTTPCASLTPTINAGQNCTVNVTFSPTTVGGKTSTLTIASNDFGTPNATVTLNGTGVNPDIAVSPVGPIPFGSVQTGQTSAATQVTITNNGTTSLIVSSIAVTGGDNTQFAVAVGGTTPCASLTPTINAGQNCTVNVTFSPTTVGGKTSTLTIASNDFGTPNATVTLNGTGVNPDIAVSPVGPIPFGSVQTGQTSAATQVTITNNGTTSLIVSSIAVTGGDNTQFAVAVGGTTPCASLTPTINAGQNCTVNVTFSPTTVGGKTSTLTIASNDFGTPNATVTLNGTGVNPDIAVSPVGPIPFGSVQTGQTSTATQVTITNNGTTSLIVSSIAVTGGDNTQFAVAVGGTTPCTSLTPTINAGQNCTVNVTFSPTTVGGKTSTLTIASNDFGTPNATVTLNGTGVNPVLSVSSPGPIPFGSVQTGQTSAATQVTISNTGTAQLDVTSIAVAGTDNTQFAVVVGGTNPCATLTPTINAGANCTVNVTFSPTTVGAKTATLAIVSNGGNADITLNGTGTSPNISVTPVGPIDFNSVLAGHTSSATQVTISNPGIGPLNVTAIAVTGGDNTQFAVAVGGTNPCATLTPTIAVSGNCTVNVTFSPTTAGGKTSKLQITSNAPTAEVTLEGTGVDGLLSLVEGTIGTEIVVEGANFGLKKGKVLIGNVAGKTAVAAKIAKDGWAEDTIICTVTKVPQGSPGTFAVTIQTKSEGASSVTLDGAFAVKLPEPDALTGANNNGAQEASITITGDFFSTKKGKIYLAYTDSKGKDKQKSCKIISWDMNAITFQVPKLATGTTYPLSISNKVGTVVVGDFTIN